VCCTPVDAFSLFTWTMSLSRHSHGVCMCVLGGEGAEGGPADDVGAAGAGMQGVCVACAGQAAFMLGTPAR
jgi:hypothetical protein